MLMSRYTLHHYTTPGQEANRTCWSDKRTQQHTCLAPQYTTLRSKTHTKLLPPSATTKCYTPRVHPNDRHAQRT